MGADPMEPTRTEIYLARDLDRLVLSTTVLMRLTGADDAPGRYVESVTRNENDGVAYLAIEFLEEETERRLEPDEPVEVGF